MSKPPDPDPAKPTPVRGSTPTPVRARNEDRPSAPPARSKRRGGGNRGGRRDSDRSGASDAKPTPARAITGDDLHASTPEPDLAEVTLSVADSEWSVTLLGRARGPHGLTAAPLLLLGFRPTSSDTPGRALEAWVVGRSLAEMTVEQLEAAFGKAAPPPDPGRTRGFFNEASDTRRR